MKNFHSHFVQMVLAGMLAATTVFAQESEENPAETVEETVTPQKPVKLYRPPREHRGFYFNASLGATYVGFNYKQSDYQYKHHYDYNNNDDSYSYERVVEEVYEFNDFAIPTLGLRFGRSFGNLVALFFELDFAMLIGEGKYSETSYEHNFDNQYSVLGSSPQNLKEKNSKDDDAYGFYSFVGVGFTFYPFRNPHSVMNGAFFSIANGFAFFGEDINHNKENLHQTFEMLDYEMQVEIGKDWWISDTWSVGLSIGYLYTFGASDDSENTFDSNVISFMFRVTRG
ncbi:MULTISPECIES: hypothetical protein [unclassified Fibrobacter]|uniref:hypothetical protein n=1 Tax=unclassified Fibrobacter TaxID=2634177 RepID=UPI00091EA623|nr:MULTISPECIES: hypothetical protein [unclassified Fibrobacter]OWV05692.1 hypothetical protein B7993_07250 [Fibrobacter sp. UWH3]SHK13683.1 hypothetical protein SAMN05720765_10116 [Fibrobacter sp. UWH6]